MPPTKGAEKKRSVRSIPVITLAVLLCALPISCARRAQDPLDALRVGATPAALSATAQQPSAAATVLRTTPPSPAVTPAIPATQAPTAPPTTAPTPIPTAKPTPRPTAKATPKPTARPAVKSTARKTSAPTAKPAVTATPAPAPGGVKSQEDKMISLVNQEREKAGLGKLKYDSTLRAGALKHSNDMSANNFFSHTSPTFGSFTNRLAAAKISYASAGENIAMYGSVEKAHAALMNSEGHRANILNETFTRIGIGIVYNKAKGVYYITQWFAK